MNAKITSINSFFGPYRWLSNYHLCTIDYEGLTYRSTEHTYQATKTLDIELRKDFLGLTCGQAKRMGNKITVRSDWESIKLQVMLDITRIKYQDPYLRKMLLDTGDAELIEGNTWNDIFWGVCGGIGQNNLGKILMQVREELE